MIYPENFELKIGFTEVRSMLRERCLSSLGKSQVDEMTFSSDAETVNEWHAQTDELRLLLEANPDFPLSNIYDVCESSLIFVALVTQFIGLYRYFIPTIRSKE